MNETLNNKVEFAKGRVRQEGYEEVICTFIKPNTNRKDSLSDKPLYVVEECILPEGMFAVTPNVAEALNRVERKTIGIINDNGEELVPVINSSVLVLNNQYIACNTSNSSLELEAKKGEPNKVQENATISMQIKDKMRSEIGNELNLLCDDFYSKYDIYEITEDKKLNKVFENASFVSLNDDAVYVHTNELEDEIEVFGKKMEEQVEVESPSVPPYEQLPIGDGKIIDDVVNTQNKMDIDIPVSNFATVQEKSFDNLDVNTNFEEVKPGAPELNVNDDSVTKNDNSIEVETEEVKDEDSSLEEAKPSEINVDMNSDDNIFKSDNFEPQNVEVNTSVVDTRDTMADIAGLVSAVKNKINKSTEEIHEQEKELDELRRQVASLKSENVNLQRENSDKDLTIKKLKSENSSTLVKMDTLSDQNRKLTSKVTQLEGTLQEVYTAFSSMIDSPEDANNYFKVA